MNNLRQQSNGLSSEDARISEAFYDRAVWRMQRTIGVSGIVIIAVSALGFGLAVALGAAFGVALSWHNFRWLTQAVNALGERITTGQSRERGGVIVFRFTARILLIALGSYAIFKIFSKGTLRLFGRFVCTRSRLALRGCLRGILRLPARTLK